jgi:hypothetical protein
MKLFNPRLKFGLHEPLCESYVGPCMEFPLQRYRMKAGEYLVKPFPMLDACPAEGRSVAGDSDVESCLLLHFPPRAILQTLTEL